MNEADDFSCTAFEGFERIASGSKLQVATKVKERLEKNALAQVLIFNNQSSELVEIDFRGSLTDVRSRIEHADGESTAVQEATRGRGRPKLGVVAREVTLLPRQWDWLNSQPGGASVALRKLVDAARRADDGSTGNKRKAQESTYKFMSAMAGNLSGFEDASRALFAGRKDQFELCISSWPPDLKQHVLMISAFAFQQVTL